MGRIEAFMNRLELFPGMLYFWFIWISGVAASFSLFFVDASAYLWYGLAVYVFGTLFGTCIGIHRWAAHRTFEANRFWRYVFMVAANLNAQCTVWAWAVGHIEYHHVYSDTDKDFQSPVNNWLAAWFGPARRGIPDDIANPSRKIKIKYAHLWRDPVIYWLANNPKAFFWSIMLVLALIDWKIAVYCWILPVFGVQQYGAIITFFGHKKIPGSYQRFDTGDNSMNNHLLALLTYGDMFHNNHHARWRAPTTKVAWHEFDLAGLVVDLIRIK